MNAPGEQIAPPTSIPSSGLQAAIVVDQYELYRLGVAAVLEAVDVHVQTSTARIGDVLRTVRDGSVDLLIVGRTADLKHQHVLREAKKQNPSLKVMLLLDQAELPDIARLLTLGADALLLRTTSRLELEDAVLNVLDGERLVAPALASGTIGMVGPTVGVTRAEAMARTGLSRKEVEVLGELAGGATYKEIAESLIVTQATVKTHLVHIYSKLGVKTRQEAVARALALGLLA